MKCTYAYLNMSSSFSLLIFAHFDGLVNTKTSVFASMLKAIAYI